MRAQRLPSLNALRAFESAARLGSLTLAARELHVTPAAISHQIKALESELGFALFSRRNGRVMPTEAAEAALEDLRAGFERLSAASRRLRSGRRERQLTVSVDPSFAAAWLVARLARFKAAHPEIEVRLDASDGTVDFARDDVDLAIRYGAARGDGIASTPLFAEEICPVCAPVFAREGLEALGDLGRFTLLHLDTAPGARAWPDWTAWLAAAGVIGVDVERGPRFSQFSLMLQAAIAGEGVALGATSLVSEDVAAVGWSHPSRCACPMPTTSSARYRRSRSSR